MQRRPNVSQRRAGAARNLWLLVGDVAGAHQPVAQTNQRDAVE